MISRVFVFLGALNAFLAVGLGAFGAHGLKTVLTPDLLAVYHTGAHYHLLHALAVLCIGTLAQHQPASLYLKLAGWLLVTGIILFSGSLYVLSISGIRQLGIITPFGGVAFLAGWFMLMLAAVKWRAADL